MSDGAIREILLRSFGYSSFRPHQEEIVQAILRGGDVFAALPTGGGKSLCYQLPSLLLPGLTVVISPLIALMEDQVRGATAYGLPAAFLNSTLDSDQARQIYRDLARGRTRLLYVSPERLANESFRDSLRSWGVSFFAVDEAHCISEWGHEFRPDYRSLSSLRTEFPRVPIAAFTATATRDVQTDVIRLLNLADPLAVRADFDRPEIFYRVRRKARVDTQILSFVRERPMQPGIVYRATRRSVEETTARLRAAGIKAAAYHAGLPDQDRRRAQEEFVHDSVQVVVATIAFGMGIDKSNVRWVLHGDLPRSLEAYYQETGRAGRDGEPSEACLFFGPEDIHTISYHIDRMEVPGEAERARQALARVLRFVDAGVCRRTQLLLHFDQEHQGDCGGCDVCAGEVERSDLTVEARKLMSAVRRTGEYFGSHHIADIVTGTRTEKIESRNHHALPTFGVGADRSRAWWIELARDLEAAGLLRRRDGMKSGLAISPRGEEVLFGRASFHSAIPRAREGPRNRSGAASPTGEHPARNPARNAARPPSQHPPLQRPGEEELFELLRMHRLEIARQSRVPPYVVFSDRTLRAMARIRPVDPRSLLRIHGVGEVKAERYGESFLAVVRKFEGL